jgi:hypothetical protein
VLFCFEKHLFRSSSAGSVQRVRKINTSQEVTVSTSPSSPMIEHKLSQRHKAREPSPLDLTLVSDSSGQINVNVEYGKSGLRAWFVCSCDTSSVL